MWNVIDSFGLMDLLIFIGWGFIAIVFLCLYFLFKK